MLNVTPGYAFCAQQPGGLEQNARPGADVGEGAARRDQVFEQFQAELCAGMGAATASHAGTIVQADAAGRGRSGVPWWRKPPAPPDVERRPGLLEFTDVIPLCVEVYPRLPFGESRSHLAGFLFGIKEGFQLAARGGVFVLDDPGRAGLPELGDYFIVITLAGQENGDHASL